MPVRMSTREKNLTFKLFLGEFYAQSLYERRLAVVVAIIANSQCLLHIKSKDKIC